MVQRAKINQLVVGYEDALVSIRVRHCVLGSGRLPKNLEGKKEGGVSPNRAFGIGRGKEILKISLFASLVERERERGFGVRL